MALREDGAALGQVRSLPVLLPRQTKSWLADPTTARLYDTSRYVGSVASARSCQSAAARLMPRSEVFYESLERSVVIEQDKRAGFLSSCRSLSNAGQMSVGASRQRPDLGLLHEMGYHGPLYNSLNKADRRESLLSAQREGDIKQFRAALRACQLHMGQDDPLVLHMREILKEADWGVRTSRTCSVVKFKSVLDRMNALDVGPRLWEIAELAGARANYAVWKASFLESADHETRKGACDSLGALGLAAVKHAPELAACLGDDAFDVANAAIQALCQMGNAGASAAASQLENEAGLRSCKMACQALAKMGSIGALHGNSIVALFMCDEEELRKTACLAFESLGKDGAAYASDVASCLTDTDAAVRRAACQALGSMGKAAVAGEVDALTVCLHDEDKDVAWVAQDVLFSIGIGVKRLCLVTPPARAATGPRRGSCSTAPTADAGAGESRMRSRRASV